MTLGQHLEQIRWCLIKSAGAVLLVFAVSYFFADHLFNFMVAPLKGILQPGQSVIGTRVTVGIFNFLRTWRALWFDFAHHPESIEGRLCSSPRGISFP